MEAMSERMNGLMETISQLKETQDQLIQKIKEADDKQREQVDQMINKLSDVECKMNNRISEISMEIEGNMEESSNSHRQDFKMKLEQISTEMRQSVEEMKWAMAKMSDKQDKRAILDKTNVHLIPEYNILLLGESGSGKSTFINSLNNYIDHDQLKDTLNVRAYCLIPTTIVVEDDNYQSKKIPIGKNDYREVKTGHSNPTCRIYVLNRKTYLLRLIDTEGFGQTDVDTLPVSILEFISHCDFSINVIAIVVKSNQSELSQQLVEFVQMLVGQTKNIRVLFLLSHSETTDYRAGDVIEPLRQLLSVVNPLSDVSIFMDSVYCFENRGFVYLLGRQSGHKYGAQFEDSYHKAWKHSALECQRLLQSLTGRRMTSVMSRQLARDLLFSIEAMKCHKLCLSYIANISKNQIEIESELDKLDKIKSIIMEQFEKRVHEIYLDVVSSPFADPQIVCASKKCRQEIPTKDGSVKQHYPQNCESLLSSLRYKSRHAFNLLRAFPWLVVNCPSCGCMVSDHMYLEYSTSVVELKDDEVSPSELDTHSEIREIDQRMHEIKKELSEYAKINEICDDYKQLSETKQGPKGDRLIVLKKQLFALEVHGPRIQKHFDKQ